MNLHCYNFAAGSFILNFKEALLEVADIKRRRDEFIHNIFLELKGQVNWVLVYTGPYNFVLVIVLGQVADDKIVW